MAEPQGSVNSVKIAYLGKPINIEDIKVEKPLPQASKISIESKHRAYEPDISVDLTDLKQVNSEIAKLRIRLHQIRKELETASRIAAKAQYEYEQKKKRILIGLSGGSDKQREAIAELMTEELLGNSIVAKTVAAEINQHSRDVRTELDALKEISNNLRKQIDLI